MNPSCLDDAALDDLVNARLSGVRLVEAEAHLDTCPECTAVVTVLAGGDRKRPTDVLPPGTLVGRHVIRERLGAGAMGVVYLAHDPELGRRVALKVVRGAAAPEAQRRMLREAQAMAQVADPHVVAIYDVGRYEEDSVYLAMEFVEGETLRTWLKTGRTESEIVEVLVQAGRGLAAAHDAGLVHRDFKPDNVLVGRGGRVRVTDFGLARVTDLAPPPDADASSSLTQSGAMLGTPSYMAPELLARGGEATAASDQFSFGVTLYEATFGVRPFAGATIAELRARIEEGPHKGTRAPSARIRRVAARALAVSTADRYPNMHALLTDLAPPRSRTWVWSVLGGAAAAAAVAAIMPRAAPLPAKPPDFCAGAKELAFGALTEARVNRIESGFKASGLTYAPAASDVVLRQLTEYLHDWAGYHHKLCETAEVHHSIDNLRFATRTACLDEGLAAADALGAKLETATPEVIAHAVEAAAALPSLDACGDQPRFRYLESRPQSGDQKPLDAVDAGLARTRAAMVDTTGTASLLEDARKLAASADAIGYRPTMAEAHLLLATLLRRSGAFADATREVNVALLAAEGSRDDRTAALTWLELLAIRGEQGNAAAVIDAGPQALAAVARLGTPPDLEGSVLFELGVARTNRGDLIGAQKDLETTLARRKQAFGEQHLDVSRTLSALGNVARAAGALDKALALHREAQAMDIEILGTTKHPALARHDHNIAGVLRLQGKLDEALASYEHALALEKEGLGPTHLAVGRTENSIGLVWLQRGDSKVARMHFEAAQAILANHPDVGLVLHNLGLTDAAEGNHAGAIEHYDEALAIDRPALAADNPEIKAVEDSRRKSMLAMHRPAAPARPPPAPTPFAGSYAPAQTWDTTHR